MNQQQIAERFSSHRFAETYDYLSLDVRWSAVGGPATVGRDAVIAACEASSAELASTTTTFRSFRSVVGADAVVVDAVAEYREPEGTSIVSSCDLYDFADGLVVAITSYAVELDE
jgi:SnoaL-like domain